MKQTAIYTTTSIIFLLFIVSSFSFFTIYHQVKDTCISAEYEYGEDCVNSLSKRIRSNDASFREKNKAIWTLGQLADKRALPLLYSLYTGNIPRKESLDKTISQYELKKAIRWCEHGNITHWMYRNQDSWN